MTDDRPSWLPDEIDPTKPSIARVYDFYLGGSHNFEADREFGRRALEAFPDAHVPIRDNRHFLRRAVTHACHEGVTQFLDLGAGIPTAGTVHEVAQNFDPAARVVYVDHDPVAVAHGSALLESNPYATTIHGDLREPDRVVADALATGLLDLDRPIQVLLASVLHFVQDEERPAEIVSGYVRVMAPGSLLALSHARSDGNQEIRRMAGVYEESDSPGRPKLRSLAEITALFGDLTILEPGVVATPRWRPELTGDTTTDADEQQHSTLAGVGRRD